MKEDYPLDILNKRKELLDQLRQEKQLGNMAYLSYDKLIILKDKEQHHPRSHNNKRNLSESPELYANNQIVKKDQKQTYKKNKTSNMKDFIIQKPKFNYIPTETSHDQPENKQKNGTQINNNKE